MSSEQGDARTLEPTMRVAERGKTQNTRNRNKFTNKKMVVYIHTYMGSLPSCLLSGNATERSRGKSIDPKVTDPRYIPYHL